MNGNDCIIISGYPAPCGELVLGSYGDRLCLCDWQTGRGSDSIRRRLRRLLKAGFVEGRSPVVDHAVVRLDEYFAGRRQAFDVPLLFAGTEFQKRVWNALLAIPYGETVSYAEMARRIGMPKAVRAVANANGANAVSIFAPCHRVIGSDHTLTGYGGGLAAKAYLLRLENAVGVKAGGVSEWPCLDI